MLFYLYPFFCGRGPCFTPNHIHKVNVWKIQSCPVDDVISISSTSRCERCIHDIVSTSFISMYYPVYIVDIVDTAMWAMYTRYRVNMVYIDVLSCLHRRYRRIAMLTMYTRYRVNIVYIDVLSCLHRRYRRHHDMNNVYTISCQHRLHRCTILFTSSTSSTSRCERCIHDIVTTSFTSIYYHVDIVDTVDIAMWNIVSTSFHIDVLSCLYRPFRRHRDSWNEWVFWLILLVRSWSRRAFLERTSECKHLSSLWRKNRKAGLRIKFCLDQRVFCACSCDVTMFRIKMFYLKVDEFFFLFAWHASIHVATSPSGVNSNKILVLICHFTPWIFESPSDSNIKAQNHENTPIILNFVSNCTFIALKVCTPFSCI